MAGHKTTQYPGDYFRKFQEVNAKIEGDREIAAALKLVQMTGLSVDQIIVEMGQRVEMVLLVGVFSFDLSNPMNTELRFDGAGIDWDHLEDLVPENVKDDVVEKLVTVIVCTNRYPMILAYGEKDGRLLGWRSVSKAADAPSD